MIRSLAAVGCVFMATIALAGNQPPVIKHSPVTKALQAQGIVVRATVKDDADQIRSVTLYYSLTKDMAPYKIDMQDSGSGLFTGTISPELLSGLNRAYYYVEAKDQVGTISETPWYTVDISAGGEKPTAPVNGGDGEDEPSSWVKPTLIGVGVVAAGGLAVALSNSGGGDDDDGTPAPDPDPGTGSETNEFAGTYSGTATTCFAPPGEASTCSLSPISIAVSEDGVATSDTLIMGERLTSSLSGNDFLFVGTISESNMTGQIEFLGTIVNDRITGTIQGSATSTNGTGTYSGNFSAVRQ